MKERKIKISLLGSFDKADISISLLDEKFFRVKGIDKLHRHYDFEIMLKEAEVIRGTLYFQGVARDKKGGTELPIKGVYHSENGKPRLIWVKEKSSELLRI